MGILRDWPPLLLLADAAEDVAAYREQGLEDAEDKLKTENPHNNNKPFAVFGSHDEDEQPKTLTTDDQSMVKDPRIITIFGTDIFCIQEAQAMIQVPGLPETLKEMIQGMEGSAEKLILQKTLKSTDLSKHHGRLSVPLNQVKAEFLTDEEKNVLEQGSKQGIEALAIDPGLKKRDMSLKRWEMNKKNGKPNSALYILTSGWNLVVKDNGLKENDSIQIWSFRANAKLCFALVIVDPNLVGEGR